MAGWAGVVRAAALRRGWSARQGHVVRIENGIVCLVYEFADWFRFYAFPAIWNEKLWHLLDLDAQSRGAVTRHATGMSVPVPLLAAAPVRATELEDRAEEMLDFADELRAQSAGWPVHDLDWQKDRDVLKTRPADTTLTEMIVHLIEGRPDDAVEIARAVVAGERRASVIIVGLHGMTAFEAVLSLAEETSA